MDAAFDGGVNFIDTADVYPLGSDDVGTTESIVGRWLAGRPRDQVVLATKCVGAMGPSPNQRGASRQHILSAVDESAASVWGPTTSISISCTRPTGRCRWRKQCRPWTTSCAGARCAMSGSSNYRAWQLALSLGASDRAGITRFDCDQPRYNILWRDIESDLLPLCRDQGVGIIAYNPLGGGFLTGKYRNTEDLRDDTRFTLGSAGPSAIVPAIGTTSSSSRSPACRPTSPSETSASRTPPLPGCWPRTGSRRRSWEHRRAEQILSTH